MKKISTTLFIRATGSFAVFFLAILLMPSVTHAMNTTGWYAENNVQCAGTAISSFTYTGDNLANIPIGGTGGLPSDYQTPNKYCISEYVSTPSDTGKLGKFDTSDPGSGGVTSYSWALYSGITTTTKIPGANYSNIAYVVPSPSIIFGDSANGAINVGSNDELSWEAPQSPNGCTSNNFSTSNEGNVYQEQLTLSGDTPTIQTEEFDGSAQVSPTQSTKYMISCGYIDVDGNVINVSSTLPVTVIQPLNNSALSCQVKPLTANVNQVINWIAGVASGYGTPPYSFSWNGDGFLSGATGSSVSGSYSTGGTKYGSVTVTDSSSQPQSTTYTPNVSAGYECAGSVTGYEEQDLEDSGSNGGAGANDQNEVIRIAEDYQDWYTATPPGFSSNPSGYCVDAILKQLCPRAGQNGICIFNLDDRIHNGTATQPVPQSAYNTNPLSTNGAVAPGYYGDGLAYEGAVTFTQNNNPGNGPETASQICLDTVTVNGPPAPPTLICPASGTTGQPVSFSLSAADPNGESLRYGMDWNDDGTADAWMPSDGTYVPSGTSENFSYTWNTPGTYTVQGLAQNMSGLNSPWSQCTVNITNAAQPNLQSSIPTTATAVVGQSISLPATISNVGNAPTGAPFYDTYWLSNSSNMANATDPFTYPDGGTSFESGIPNGFPAGYSETIGQSGIPSVTYTFTSPGTYYVQVDTNSDASGNHSTAFTESSYSDNASNIETITVTALPSISATLPGNLTGTVGVAVPVGGTVTNQNAPTGKPFRDTYWFATDPQGNNIVGTAPFTSGIPNGFPAPYSEVEPQSYTFSASGTYYYRLCADETNTWASDVTVSDPNNLCSGWDSITVSYPQTGGSCTYTPSSTGTNLPVTWTATPSGGSGAYTYSWSGTNLSGTGQTTTSSYTTPGTYQGQVTISSGGSQATEMCGSVNVVSCTPTLTAKPSIVNEGGSTVLTWTENPICSSSCTLSNGTTGGSSGSSTVYPPTPASGSTDTYSVTCGNSINTTTTNVTVLVPTASLSASPTLVANGGSSTLTYQCGNSTSGYITPAVASSISADGNQHTVSTLPITSQTKYTLMCSANGYVASASAVVNVPPTYQNF